MATMEPMGKGQVSDLGVINGTKLERVSCPTSKKVLHRKP